MVTITDTISESGYLVHRFHGQAEYLWLCYAKLKRSQKVNTTKASTQWLRSDADSYLQWTYVLIDALRSTSHI